MPREPGFKQNLCADMDGFSLHAAVRCDADERQALEQLCRHITRRPLANERVQCNAAGQVVLKLRTSRRNGAAHLVIPMQELMQRLAGSEPLSWPPPAVRQACDRLLSIEQFKAMNVSSGSTAGTPGSDRLVRDLPFAVASQSTDGWVHPDPPGAGARECRLPEALLITRSPKPARRTRGSASVDGLQASLDDRAHQSLRRRADLQRPSGELMNAIPIVTFVRGARSALRSLRKKRTLRRAKAVSIAAAPPRH
jgi:hypothetical protein